jgi:hypothetical protein
MRSTIQQRFEAFHQANPWIYRVLVQMIQELRDHGVTRFGVRSLWEVLRWKITMGQVHVPDGDFKLNDNFISRYARLLIANNPEYVTMFELRALRAR